MAILQGERGRGGIDLKTLNLLGVAGDDDATAEYLTADELQGFDTISIEAPDVAQVGAITVYAYRSGDETTDGAWNQVESPPGTAITVARAKTIVIKDFPFRAIRLQSAGTETADHAFLIRGFRGTH